MPPQVLVLRAPGTNCDVETAHAFQRCGAKVDRVHVNRLLDRPATLDGYQVLALPGGFSFGDDLGAGRILGGLIRGHLGDAFRAFRDAGKLILGVCNGFQILMKSGLLLDDVERAADDGSPRKVPPATLTWNNHGRFEARWTRLRATSGKCVFLANIDTMELPIAHAEGKFVPIDDEVFSALDAAGQLALRYAGRGQRDERGQLPFPENPNGSTADVAGVCDSSGRVFGLMPHPERHVDATQHPRWTRHPPRQEGDGLAIFRNAVNYFH